MGELFSRHVEQTFAQRKPRSLTADHAELEAIWSLQPSRTWIFRQLDPGAVAKRGRSRRQGPRGPSVVRDANPWSRRHNQGHTPVTCHNRGCTIDNDRTVFDVRCSWLRSRRPTLDFCRPCLEPLAAWWAEPQSWTTVATPASLFPSEASA